MQVQSVAECDSMDSDELENIERQILQREGPTLGQVESPRMPNLFTIVSSTGFIRALPQRGGKEVKYIGNSEQAAFRAFYYLLLHIQLQERRSYPHLRSIIRQQISKDYILRKQQEEQEQMRKSKERRLNYGRKKVRKDSRDNICEMYFEMIHQWGRIEDFIMRNYKFDGICLNMIQNLISNKNKFFPITEEEHENDEKAAENRQKDSPEYGTLLLRRGHSKKSLKKSFTERNIGEEYQFLCRVFNIDCEILVEGHDTYSAYRIGSTRRFFVVNEAGHIFVVMLGLQLSNSGRKYSNADSELLSNASTPMLPQVIEASEESTPKFIEGHESSIRYRKKSHKNSFGGDMEIMSYRDLRSSLHQLKDTKQARQDFERYIENQKKKPEKVLSERFEAQEMGELEELDQEESKKRNTSKGNEGEDEDIPDRPIKKNNVTRRTMRKSHCETGGVYFESFLDDRGKILEDSSKHVDSITSSRRKRMSSSACLEQEQADKLAMFSNKISFSKHDRNKFFPSKQRQEAPEREPSEGMMNSAYHESMALNNNVANIKSNLISNYAYPQSRALQIVLMGNNKRIIDSKIEELPFEEVERSNQSISHRTPSHRSPRQGKDGSQNAQLTSEAIIQLLEPSIRDKLQSRKFSEFIHKNGLSPNDKNKIALLNKSANKAIEPTAMLTEPVQVGTNGFRQRRKSSNKQRFKENPIDELDRSSSSMPMSPMRAIQRINSTNYREMRYQIASKVVSYCNEQQMESEPEGWVRKEVTYFFANKPSESKGYFHSQKKEMPLNINLTKSTDRRFRPYDGLLKHMKKSDNNDGRSIIYEKESHLESAFHNRKQSTVQQNGSVISKLNLRSANNFNHDTTGRTEGQKKVSNYGTVISPKNVPFIDQTRKNSVSFSVYSRKTAFDEQGHALLRNHNQLYSPENKHFGNTLLQTSLSGGNIRHQNQDSQGTKSGRNRVEQNGQKQEQAMTAIKAKDSATIGRTAVNYFSKNMSGASHQNSTNTSNNLPTNVPESSNGYNKYRPFIPHQVISPGKGSPVPVYHPFTSTSPKDTHNTISNGVNLVISNDSHPAGYPPITAMVPHERVNTITHQEGQRAGSPVNSPAKAQPVHYQITQNAPISPTSIMHNSDPTEPQPLNPVLQYSTSMEHIVTSSKNGSNLFVNEERRNKVLEQSKHHRGSINFMVYTSVGSARRDSPNHSNTGMNVANANGGLVQGVLPTGYRPPSNTGTVSSRANTSSNTNANSAAGNTINTNYLYYRR